MTDRNIVISTFVALAFKKQLWKFCNESMATLINQQSELIGN